MQSAVTGAKDDVLLRFHPSQVSHELRDLLRFARVAHVFQLLLRYLQGLVAIWVLLDETARDASSRLGVCHIWLYRRKTRHGQLRLPAVILLVALWNGLATRGQQLLHALLLDECEATLYLRI